MNGRDLSFTGLGIVVAAGQAVKNAFEALVHRGEAVRPGDGTLAGAVDELLTRDVPSALGYALGTVVEETVRSVEVARELADEASRRIQCAMDAVLTFAGVPSARDLAELRGRLERVGTQLDALSGRPPAPPWEEADAEAPVH